MHKSIEFTLNGVKNKKHQYVTVLWTETLCWGEVREEWPNWLEPSESTVTHITTAVVQKKHLGMHNTEGVT